MADHLEQRVERLERNAEQVWSAINSMKESMAKMAESLATVRVTLENIADSVEKLVDGRGTVRCVEHQLGLQGVRQDLQRCAEDKANRLGRVEGKFVAFEEDLKKTMARMWARLEFLEDAHKAETNKRKGAMFVIGIVGSIVGAIGVPLIKWLLGS